MTEETSKKRRETAVTGSSGDESSLGIKSSCLPDSLPETLSQMPSFAGESSPRYYSTCQARGNTGLTPKDL